MRIRRVVQLTEEPTGLIACEAGTGKMWPLWARVTTADIAAIHRDLLARGRDVPVNVNVVPVRATREGEDG